MSTDDDVSKDAGADDASAPRDIQDLVLSLNFVPTWARESAGQNPYGQFRAEGRSDQTRSAPGRKRDDRAGRFNKGSGKKPSRPFEGRGKERGGPRRDDYPARGERSEREADRLPVEISFIPERQKLSVIVKELHATNKAYPLSYLAHVFLASPENHMVKIEVHPPPHGHSGIQLYQCALTGAVFTDKNSLESFAINQHLDKFYDVEDIQVEPPAGNYVCVARCKRSGVLLGPPNYHGYNEKIQEVRKTRFPHLSLDEYRNNIEMIHDPAVIEQWKDECRKQRVYKIREAADAKPMKRAEAEKHFLEHHSRELFKQGARFIVPAGSINLMDNNSLKRSIQDAWFRESRNGFRMCLALRPAFRRMRLHLFKAGGRETFVTAVPPRPIDADHTVEPIKTVLRLLQEHPGCTRQQVVEKLCVAGETDAAKVAELLNPLRWLIEKGHVIEFFNGTLSIPQSL